MTAVVAVCENGGIGRTRQFAEVVMQGACVPPAGELIQARVTDVGPTRLIGEIAA